MGLLSDFLNLFLPPVCVYCKQRLINEEKYICLDCLFKLPKTNYHKTDGNKLEDFLAGRFPFIRIAAYAPFSKGNSIQSIIHELKYRDNPGLGTFIGELCGKEMTDSNFLRDIDLLVPVPLHPKKEKERGYNQSLKIAEGLSTASGIKICHDNLERKINNPSQTKQSRYERWKNIEGIFGLKNPPAFTGKHILLIDDILTTGSTIEACAKTILNECENTEISIFTFGFAT